MLRVYVAGPYTRGDVAVNVRNAIAAAVELLDAGHAPFIPHLCHFVHMQAPRPYETWIGYDNAFLPVCNAVVRLPGESAGADYECELAGQLEIPVFDSVAAFLRAMPK